MTHGCVTLDEVFSAAGARAASLVPETSGYLALAIGDATSRLPFAIEERAVMLTTEGNVGITRRGDMLPPRQAAKGLRDVLSRLLSVSQGTAMPALAHAGRRRDESDRGVDTVVEEIEAALIPVNRAAARRALARLARETIKAKEAGKLKARAPKAPSEATKPAAPPPEPAAPQPEPVAPPPVLAARIAEPVVVTPPPMAAKIVVQALASPAEAAPQAPIPAPAPETPAPTAAAPPRWEPPSAEAEPTPTVLGMSAMAIDGPAPEPESEPLTALEIATVAASPAEPPRAQAAPAAAEDQATAAVAAVAAIPDDEPARALDDDVPTDLGEPAVLMQPSDEPEDAFDLGRRAARTLAEPMTPPFALEAEPAPRELPRARAVDRAPAPRAPTHTHTARAGVHTRADDLLARFGASCVDDAGMREAAACLRRIAGLEPTPPPARVEIRVAPEPPSYEALEQIPRDAETPLLPRVRARRAWSLSRAALTLTVLAAGLVAGGALARLRPDLLGVGLSPAAARPPAPAPSPEPGAARPEPAVAPPQKTAF